MRYYQREVEDWYNQNKQKHKNQIQQAFKEQKMQQQKLCEYINNQNYENNLNISVFNQLLFSML